MPTSTHEREDTKKNNLVPILVGLLVVAVLLIVHLYTKVQLYEKGSVSSTGANTKLQPTVGQQSQQLSGNEKVEIKIEDDDPSIGPKNAKVVVVSFEDFQCPFCGAFSGHNAEMVKNMQSRDPNWQPAGVNIRKEYADRDKVLFVWKDYPFLGQESQWAAQAGRCAHEQGKFWQFHDYLFSNQKGENQGQFSKENLKKFAGQAGLTTAKFNECFESEKHIKAIEAEVAYAQSIGVASTPSNYVNGKPIIGAASFTAFKAAIEEELKK